MVRRDEHCSNHILKENCPIIMKSVLERKYLAITCARYQPMYIIHYRIFLEEFSTEEEVFYLLSTKSILLNYVVFVKIMTSCPLPSNDEIQL